MSEFWDRLEPDNTDETLIEGLQARVADPLWMLARQWQTGELDGEDAASPFATWISHETLPLTTLTTPDGRRHSIAGNPTPLEPLVEAIPPSATSAEDFASLGAAAIADLPRGVDRDLMRKLLRLHYPVETSNLRPQAPVPQPALRRLRVLARHGFDPFAMAQDKAQALAADKNMPRMKAGALDRWVQSHTTRCAQRGRAIAEKTDAWDAHKLEYQATLSTRAGDEQVDLALSQYGGGRLDWYSFDGNGSAAKSVGGARLTKKRVRGTPMALTYAGQPVSRFWEFEDAAVHFGGLSAGPADIARMVVADFAAIGGDDVFVIPFDVPVGALARVTKLEVRDVFGYSHTVKPAREMDKPSPDGTRPFSMFELGESSPPETGVSPWVPVLPVLANAMDGPALERISLRRDEDANMAWAIEEEIEGPFGRPLRRRQAWEPKDFDALEPGDAWPYRVQTDVPPWWIPLVPERVAKGGQIHLRRARMGVWETLPPDQAGPKSRAMDPTRPVTLAEHALPVSGLELTRHWQLGRAYDGKLVLWQSWRRRTGAVARPSGLQFDAIARKW